MPTGQVGPSGGSGGSGSSGFSGYSGFSGRSGYSGYSGLGTSGYSGYSGSAAGIVVADTQVLFADGANNPAGDAGLTYNKTTDTLTAATALVADSAKIGDMAADGYATFAHKDVAAESSAMWQGNAGDTVVNAGGGQSIAFRIANGFSPSAGILTSTSFTLGVVLKLTPVAFTSLPAGSEGMMAWVTDSNTATWGATIAGGGANNVLAIYNGSNWTVAGA